MRELNEYRVIFSEIIGGFSVIHHNQFGPLYIKHLSYLDISNFDVYYHNFFKEARDQKIPTYKEREEYILKNGLWENNDELSLIQNEKMLQDLKITFSKEFLVSKRNKQKIEIESTEQRVNALKLKKNYYIGYTAEAYASNKLHNYRVVNSLYQDSSLSKPFDSLDTDFQEKEFEELCKLYSFFQDRFGGEALKKISISPFFTNIFYLSPDEPNAFYGKPIINLTMYQADLWSYARYFKSIISENSNHIPKEIMNDPDDLMEWIELRNNAKSAGLFDEKEDAGSSSIPGATKEDLNKLGIKTNAVFNLSEELKKKGGKLSTEDLYNLYNK